MRPLFKLFIIGFSLLLSALLIPAVIHSCGPDVFPGEMRLALFKTDLNKYSGLKPFYYSENPFNLTLPDPEGEDRKKNCREWVTFSDGKVLAEDVKAIQYDSAGQYFKHAWKSNDWNPYRNNTFVQWLLNHRDALSYMYIAKQIEEAQQGSADPWDTVQLHTADLPAELAQSCIAKADDVTLPVFLRQRYAFQAIKLLYYTSQGSQRALLISRLYHTYLEKANSILSGWIKVYYAGAEGRKTEETRTLLQAFDETEEKKRVCYQRISRADLDSLLAVSRDKKERALAATLKALKTPAKAIELVDGVYSNNPASKYLPLLITREINKAEDRIWSRQILGFDPETPDYGEIKDIDSAHLENKKYTARLCSLTEKIYVHSKGNRVFLQLALTHLYNLQKNWTKAAFLLTRIKTADTAYQNQKLIERLILTANTADITRPEVKDRLAFLIKQLMKINPGYQRQMDFINYDGWGIDPDDETLDDLSELYVLLSNRYKLKGDVVTAALLYNRANVLTNFYKDHMQEADSFSYAHLAYLDRFGSPSHIDKVLAFKHAVKHTAFENLLIPQTWGADEMLLDLKGTMLFREQKFETALAVFNNISDTFWSVKYGFKDYLPKNAVSYIGKNILEKEKPVRYPVESKKLITAELVSLLQQLAIAKEGEEKAALCYQLGKVFYNTSYAGKAWMMFAYGKSWAANTLGSYHSNYDWWSYNYYSPHKKLMDIYYKQTLAKEFFTKAMGYSHNNELKARCLLGLQVCLNGEVFYEGQKETETSSSPYLKQLQAYQNTAIYKEAVTTCPDVQAYATSNH